MSRGRTLCVVCVLLAGCAIGGKGGETTNGDGGKGGDATIKVQHDTYVSPNSRHEAIWIGGKPTPAPRFQHPNGDLVRCQHWVNPYQTYHRADVIPCQHPR